MISAKLQRPHQYDPLVAADDSDLKFRIYLKTKEIEQINSLLQPIISLNPRDRRAWVKSNGSVIDTLVEGFMHDTQEILDGATMDREGLDLSVELVTQLRDVMGMLQGLLLEHYKQRESTS